MVWCLSDNSLYVFECFTSFRYGEVRDGRVTKIRQIDSMYISTRIKMELKRGKIGWWLLYQV